LQKSSFFASLCKENLIDLLVPWNWEFDAPFVELLRGACEQRKLGFLALDDGALCDLPAQLTSGTIKARCALDRAWDADDDWREHEAAMHMHVPRVVNPYARVRHIINKPRMHYLLMQHGFYVPYLMVIPSHDKAPNTQLLDLAPLGGRFGAKAAHGGGSGVLHPMSTWEEVQAARKEWPADETILQAWIAPRMLGERPAWFRIFYACGKTFPCWQNDRSHVQTPVTAEDEAAHGLHVLHEMTSKIAGLIQINAFSTEIALDANNVWQVVDYVNEPCDYRPQSTAANGVPDAVVHAIAEAIADWARPQSDSV
jgi:hypothetical protein